MRLRYNKTSLKTTCTYISAREGGSGGSGDMYVSTGYVTSTVTAESTSSHQSVPISFHQRKQTSTRTRERMGGTFETIARDRSVGFMRAKGLCAPDFCILEGEEEEGKVYHIPNLSLLQRSTHDSRPSVI